MLPATSRIPISQGVKSLASRKCSARILSRSTDSMPCWPGCRGLTTVFYDGKCGLCSKEIDHYRKIAPQGRIEIWQLILKRVHTQVFSTGKMWPRVRRSLRSGGLAWRRVSGWSSSQTSLSFGWRWWWLRWIKSKIIITIMSIAMIKGIPITFSIRLRTHRLHFISIIPILAIILIIIIISIVESS